MAVAGLYNPTQLSDLSEAVIPQTVPQFWPPNSLDYRNELILPANELILLASELILPTSELILLANELILPASKRILPASELIRVSPNFASKRN